MLSRVGIEGRALALQAYGPIAIPKDKAIALTQITPVRWTCKNASGQQEEPVHCGMYVWGKQEQFYTPVPIGIARHKQPFLKGSTFYLCQCCPVVLQMM